MPKLVAPKGKLLYCKKLKRFATATTDTKHEWIIVDKEEKENAKQ